MTALTVQSVCLGEKDFQKISDIVYEHCGINLYKDKKELIRTRVAKRLRLGNFKTSSEYIKYVLDDKTGKEFSLPIVRSTQNMKVNHWSTYSGKRAVSLRHTRHSSTGCWKQRQMPPWSCSACVRKI